MTRTFVKTPPTADAAGRRESGMNNSGIRKTRSANMRGKENHLRAGKAGRLTTGSKIRTDHSL
jgi:hypothetical protein